MANRSPDGGLPPGARDLLARARAPMAPTSQSRARVRGRLAARLAATSASAGVLLLKGLLASAAGKVSVLVLATAAVTSATYATMAARRRDPPPRATASPSC